MLYRSILSRFSNAQNCLQPYVSMICAIHVPRSCWQQMRTQKLLASDLGTPPSLLLWTFTRMFYQICSKEPQTNWKGFYLVRRARNRAIIYLMHLVGD